MFLDDLVDWAQDYVLLILILFREFPQLNAMIEIHSRYILQQATFSGAVRMARGPSEWGRGGGGVTTRVGS